MTEIAMERLAGRFPKLVERLSVAKAIPVDRNLAQRSMARDWNGILDRWIEGLPLVENSIIALSGIGDGSHLRKLLSYLPSGCAVYCLEPSLEQFAYALSVEENGELWGDVRLYFAVGEVDENYFEAIDQMPVLDAADVSATVFAPCFNADSDYFGKAFSEFAQRIEYWRKLVGTQVTASGLWQRNTLRNMRALIGAPDLAIANGAFSDLPLALVSAGPSLDESLETIRALKGKALIIAVNSSYQALRNAGIVPEFVIAADPYEYTDKGFEQAPTDQTILICNFIVYPAVAKRFAGRCLTWSDGNMLASNMRLALGLGIGSKVTEQGTVSACVFDIARIFGCRELILFGQDLAFAADGRTHASDTFYSTLKANGGNLAECRMLPGNTLETVAVESKLFVYLRTFEELAARNADWIGCRNTARLGAKIDGVPYVTNEVIRDEFSRRDTVKDIGTRMDRARSACSERGVPAEKIVAELKRFESYLGKTLSLSLRVAIGFEMVDWSALDESMPRIRETWAARQELIAHIESDGRYAVVMQDGEFKLELLEHYRELRRIRADAEKVEKDGREVCSYCWALADGAYALLSDVRTALAASSDT